MSGLSDLLHEIAELNRRLDRVTKGSWAEDQHPRQSDGRFAPGGMTGQDYEHHISEASGGSGTAYHSGKEFTDHRSAGRLEDAKQAATTAASGHDQAAQHWKAVGEDELAQAHKDAADAARAFVGSANASSAARFEALNHKAIEVENALNE